MSVSPFYYGFYDAQLERNGGTSAASPVWAGIIGLLNAARLKAGKSAIGFFNPLLYNGAYAAMTDITKGQSIGCNGQDTQTGANGMLILSFACQPLLWRWNHPPWTSAYSLYSHRCWSYTVCFLELDCRMGPCHRMGCAQLRGSAQLHSQRLIPP